MPSPQDAIAAGRAALLAADWPAAKGHFEQSLQLAESAEAHDGLGIALWWLNDVSLAHQHRIIAYNGYKQQGEPARAAVIAGWLAREQMFLHGNAAAMNGWFARAERLQQQIGPGLESAWCEILRASMTAPPEALEQAAGEAIQVAQLHQDQRLEAFSMAFSGLARVIRGRVQAGMAQLDEAMTMTTGGEVQDYMVISEVFCVLLSACEIAGDLVRSEQWCRVAADFAERHRCPFLSAYCRTTYGSLLTTLGRWQEAEMELEGAMRAFSAGHRGLRVHALFKLADLRVSQGRLEEAQQLLAGFEDQDGALAPLARLHLARGQSEMARAVLAQALESAEDATLYRIPYLSLLTEVMLAMNDVAGALQAADELEALAERTRSDFLIAQAALTVGKAHRQAGKDDALGHFSASIQLLKRYEQSLLAGEARFQMAQSLRDSDRPGAIAWARAALATFERIGAAGRAAETMSLLRGLGVAGKPGARTPAALTPRETEILALLGQGLTNREIGERLFISARTVEHHVGRILGKLNLRNRAEAAAYVSRDR